MLSIEAKQVIAKGKDAASQDPVWQVDFSAFDKPGKYKLASGSAESDAFEIGKNLYRTAVVAGLKSFYFQRCRTALVEPFATWEGKSYLRKGACHDHDEVGWDLVDHPAKKKRWKNEGGWHDAGNFDMYIPSTAVAAQTLLLAYEWAPGLFPDKQLNIPESGNGASDLLDEVKFGLIWILSMQEPGGGFRHRDAMIEWSPEGPADNDKTVRWVGHLSSSSTAKAVAVLALAARLYDKDKAFATRATESAKKGWKWLLDNPAHLRAKRVGGGEQPLWDDEPENNDVGARFAAAAEMWRTFRDAEAMKKAEGGHGHHRGQGPREDPRGQLGEHQPLRPVHPGQRRQGARRSARRRQEAAAGRGRADAPPGGEDRRLPLRLGPGRLLLGQQLQPDGEAARADDGRPAGTRRSAGPWRPRATSGTGSWGATPTAIP